MEALVDEGRETTGTVNHVVVRSTSTLNRRFFVPTPLISFILATSMEKLQARLQATSTGLQKLQSDLSIAVDSMQSLDAQLQGNEMIKKVD